IVQSADPEARAAGIEAGDRLLTIDGRSTYHWFLHPEQVLHAGQVNHYELEREGTRYTADLSPKPCSIASLPAWETALHAALLVVAAIYLAIGFVVWRLRPDRAES